MSQAMGPKAISAPAMGQGSTSGLAPGFLPGLSEPGRVAAAAVAEVETCATTPAMAGPTGISPLTMPASPLLPASGPEPAGWWAFADGPGGANIAAAWALASGQGVTVGLVDSVVNGAHLDLVGSVRPAIEPLAANPASSPHGTQVAGLIAGKIDNQIGGMGVAFGASVVAQDISYGATVDIARVARALQAQSDVDVSNNSWGFTQAFADSFRSPTLAPIAAALSQAVLEGRDGLGTAMVFAGGNGRMMIGGSNLGDDSNFHNLTNSRHSIAVGASDANGRATLFSSPGTNLLLSAPGTGLVTADGQEPGAIGQANVAGTSFSAPLVSGTIALMLQVNPALGYRDIQTILLLTARAAAPEGGVQTGLGAQANAANLLNGGGLVFDRDIGFGLLDAAAAVRLAAAWRLQAHAGNEAQIIAGATSGPVQSGPRHEILVEVPPPDQGFALGWVELGLSVSAAGLRQMQVQLQSPSGTLALIAPNLQAMGNRTSLSFDFSSLATWGEEIAGTWRIILTLPDGTQALALHEAELRFFGDLADSTGYGAGIHYFNRSFAAQAAADPDRAVIAAQADQPGALVFAALDTAVRVDLAAGSGRIDGVDVTLQGQYDRITGGAAADEVHGSTGDERLIGGRGGDWLTGAGGSDVLLGQRGNDTLDGGTGQDILQGGWGNDTYVVDAAGDRVRETRSRDDLSDAGGIDTVLSSVSVNLDAHAGVRFVENLTLTGSANLNGTGNALANRLTGNAGNNALFGGAGDDTLAGGRGQDRLTGGAGSDSFVFYSAVQASGADLITDFDVNEDVICLDHRGFGGFAPGSLPASAFAASAEALAQDGLQRLLYETDTGRLFLDADGTGSGAPVLLARLTAGLLLSEANFTVF